MDQAIPQPVEDEPRSDLKLRLGGLLSLAGGAALGWFLILRPLRQARAGAPAVSMEIKGAFVLVPLLLVVGAVYAIGGARVKYRDTSVHPPRPLPMLWVIMGLTLALGGFLFWYMQTQLASLGYR